MGYMHIDNLYKSQDILMFKECYALEKIHGTSAHISMTSSGELRFFAGGVSHDSFVRLFDKEAIEASLRELGEEVTVYGEAYGGKCQGMSDTYGKDLRFVVFDVKIGDCWLAVPQAQAVTLSLGLEFVDYVQVPTTLEALNAERDKPSEQAVRNGVTEPKKREGVVLRPLIELTKNNGSRVICKYKGEEFGETKAPRQVSPEKLQVLSDAKTIAEEWVTPMRLVHVLDKLGNPGIEKMPDIMKAMLEDIRREGEGEIEWSRDVERAVGKATAEQVKAHIKAKLVETAS